MRELYIGASDDADVLDDLVGLLLQALLQILIDGQHRGGTEGIACVDADRVDILDKTDSDHIACAVAHDFEFELLPAKDRLLDKDLVDQTRLKAALADSAKLVSVVDKTAAGTAHRVCGAQNDRITQLFRDRKSFLHRIGHFTARHFDAELIHGLFELNTVFTPFDRVDLNADDFDAVFVEYALFVKFGAEIEAGLAAEIGKERIRSFFGDDLFHALCIKRFDIGDVRHLGIRHDRGGIGIDKNDLITKTVESLAGLCSGIIKLTCLADDDGARADDQDLMDISTLCHGSSLSIIRSMLDQCSRETIVGGKQ